MIDTWYSSHIHIRIETNKGNVCWPYSQSKWWLKNYCLLLRKTWLLNLITSFVFHLRFWFVKICCKNILENLCFPSIYNENLKNTAGKSHQWCTIKPSPWKSKELLHFTWHRNCIFLLLSSIIFENIWNIWKHLICTVLHPHPWSTTSSAVDVG